jgi:hypothetical protein
MERDLVFKVINQERDYQDAMSKDPERPDMIPDLHVGDTLAAIQYNLNLALKEWYKGSTPHKDTTEYLRKIAALCVQVGEKHGMPPRMFTIN